MTKGDYAMLTYNQAHAILDNSSIAIQSSIDTAADWLVLLQHIGRVAFTLPIALPALNDEWELPIIQDESAGPQ
jgi:hypothetical protein